MFFIEQSTWLTDSCFFTITLDKMKLLVLQNYEEIVEEIIEKS